jgi:hypothetical protein
MDTFKKIYLIAIILTIFSFGTLALVSTGNISIYGETGSIVYLLAASLLVGLFILSRIANIFGNRQNLFIGYLGAAITLVYMILLILYVGLAAAENYKAALELTKPMEFFSKLESLVLLNVLVFEIPYVNSTHKKIQYVAAGILTILALIPILDDKADEINISSLGSGSTSSSYSSYFKEEASQTTKDIQTILSYTGLALIVINPMLRVFWIDKDYYNARDVYEEEHHQTQLTVNDTGKVITNQNQLNKPAVDPHAQPTLPVAAPVEEKPKPRSFIPEDAVINQEEEVSEPVINENFKPTDLSQVLIPSVDGSIPTPEDTNNNPPTA